MTREENERASSPAERLLRAKALRRARKASRTKGPPADLASLRLAKLTAKPRRRHVTHAEINLPADGQAPLRKVRFGSITVSSATPDQKAVESNIKAGRDALARAREALLTRGVTLRHGAGIPTFRVEAGDPSVLIRDLDGRSERGRLVAGAFVPFG